MHHLTFWKLYKFILSWVQNRTYAPTTVAQPRKPPSESVSGSTSTLAPPASILSCFRDDDFSVIDSSASDLIRVGDSVVDGSISYASEVLLKPYYFGEEAIA